MQRRALHRDMRQRCSKAAGEVSGWKCSPCTLSNQKTQDTNYPMSSNAERAALDNRVSLLLLLLIGPASCAFVSKSFYL